MEPFNSHYLVKFTSTITNVHKVSETRCQKKSKEKFVNFTNIFTPHPFSSDAFHNFYFVVKIFFTVYHNYIIIKKNNQEDLVTLKPYVNILCTCESPEVNLPPLPLASPDVASPDVASGWLIISLYTVKNILTTK